MPVSFSSVSTPASNGSNYIINPNAEIDTAYWNLYNDTGRIVPASLVEQDLTFTSVALGDVGNGIIVNYIFHATQPSSTPLVTVVSPMNITVAWYNGPTLANNPTATQLKAAWDAVPAAIAIATVAISGTASDRQYITGSHTLKNGGDTAPVDGTGGIVTGLTFTRSTASPLAGIANFVLSKDAASREGMGVSTDFSIDNKDKGNEIQISLVYNGSAGMVLGTNSDVRVWIYDITNDALISISPRYMLSSPTGSILNFIGTFTAASNSLNYRLILHIGTTNATTWDLLFDGVVATDVITPGAVVSAPALVAGNQAVSGAVTDRMAVCWKDGATQWVPATSAGNSDEWGILGFATNIDSGTADIYLRGIMDGFSFGPFAGYNQYVDPSSAGSLTPLPSPFTDTYVIMGKAVSATEIIIQPFVGNDLITSKGGLLTNAGANNGTGDQVLAVGTNGTVPVANSAASLGIQWLAPIVATTPFTFTAATRTLTIAVATDSVAGVMSAADHTSLTADTAAKHNAVTIGTANGLSLATQVLSLAVATDSVPGALTAADHATFAAYAASIALKAPLAAPVFTGDVNASTGNIKISTLGKGLQIKTGVNSRIGTAVLVGGTVTVANTSVTANSRIFVTSQTDGGTVGFLRITAKTAATSFVITSSNLLDTSTVAWMIVESIP